MAPETVVVAPRFLPARWQCDCARGSYRNTEDLFWSCECRVFQQKKSTAMISLVSGSSFPDVDTD